MRRTCELDAAPERHERVGEPQRTVAADQRVVTAGLELGDEIVASGTDWSARRPGLDAALAPFGDA